MHGMNKEIINKKAKAMKQIIQQLFISFLLVAGGISAIHAQSTYTWDASKWEQGGDGSVSVSGGQLICTPGTYCASARLTSAFKLPKRQTFIVIKGENLIAEATDPNIYEFNGVDLGDGKLKGFTGNAGNTLLYKDITSLLPATTDFFGNATISSVGLFLKKPAAGDVIVSSIEFLSADLLDGASEITSDKASDIVLTSGDGDFKKTLTFTQSQTGNDMGITFTANQLLNSSDMFLVIESDNNSLNTSSRIKLRNQWVDGTKYENNSGGCYVAAKEVGTGRYLYIHSFYKGSDTSADLLAQWAATPSMNLTGGTLYVNNSQGTTIKFYRMGFYNLSEILALYPSLAAEKWWYTTAVEGKLDVEIHNLATQNWIRINGAAADGTNTSAYAAQLVRSMGALPSNFTTIDLSGKLKFRTDVTTCTEDAFACMPATVTEIRLDDSEVINLPTQNANVYMSGQKYFAFKEASIAVPAQKGESGGNWTSLTRTFKAGYNSLCVPFNKLQITKLPAGLTVYQLSGYDSGTGEVTFGKVTENVSANNKNTPYIVHAEQTGTYVLLGRDPETVFSDKYCKVQQGDLKYVGTYVNEVPTGDYASTLNYGITSSGTQFARMGTETKTQLYRAFLSLPSASSARQLVLSFDDSGATGISTVQHGANGGDAYYTVSGQRVARPVKGLYIVNGKKVIVK